MIRSLTYSQVRRKRADPVDHFAGANPTQASTNSIDLDSLPRDRGFRDVYIHCLNACQSLCIVSRYGRTSHHFGLLILPL